MKYFSMSLRTRFWGSTYNTLVVEIFDIDPIVQTEEVPTENSNKRVGVIFIENEYWVNYMQL